MDLQYPALPIVSQNFPELVITTFSPGMEIMKMAQVNGNKEAHPDIPVTELKDVAQSRNNLVNVVGGRNEDLNAENQALLQYLSQPTVEVQPSSLPILTFPSSDEEMASVDGTCFVNSAQTVGESQQGWDPETTERKIEEFINNNPVDTSSGQDEVEFVPLKCRKKKNPDYLVEQGIITTKNDCAVKFQVRGGMPGQEVRMSLRYVDAMVKQIPVRACKKHRSEDPTKLPPEFSFYSPSEMCKYLILGGHPTAVITLQDPKICEKENCEVVTAFLCLNSCHRNQSKLTDLVMTLFDPALGNVVKEQNFSLRVCKNVKRDHKELKRLADDPVEEAPVMKCPKREVESVPPCDDNPLSHLSTSEGSQMVMSTTKDFYLIKLSGEQREALCPLLKLIGVDDMLPVHSVTYSSPPVGH